MNGDWWMRRKRLAPRITYTKRAYRRTTFDRPNRLSEIHELARKPMSSLRIAHRHSHGRACCLEHVSALRAWRVRHRRSSTDDRGEVTRSRGKQQKKGRHRRPVRSAIAALRAAAATGRPPPRGPPGRGPPGRGPPGRPPGRGPARPRRMRLVAIGIEAAGIGVVGREARRVAGMSVGTRRALA